MKTPTNKGNPVRVYISGHHGNQEITNINHKNF